MDQILLCPVIGTKYSLGEEGVCTGSRGNYILKVTKYL
jgi:hypothetical protein